MNSDDPHWGRSQAILKEFPDVRKLFHHDVRTLWYIIACVSIQAVLAFLCSGSYTRAIVLGVTVGPFLDAGLLVIMHELSHNRCTGSILLDRLLSIASNVLMMAPISEIFRQHHNAHHLHLGDEHDDVDVPLGIEIKFVGNSPWRKALWLALNMALLPLRSLLKVEVVPNRYVVLNWVACLAFSFAVAMWSMSTFLYLFICLFMSQGLHPANARQLQRHLWDGSDGKALNSDSKSSMTFSYYGWSNALFLNVGYHNEHHDFVQVPWTNLPKLRSMVGDKWYPDSAAYATRGLGDIYDFITNPAISLSNFYSADRAPAREADAAMRQAKLAAAAAAEVADSAQAADAKLGGKQQGESKQDCRQRGCL